MKPEKFVEARGELTEITYKGEETYAFTPPKLPVDLDLDAELVNLLDEARGNLGQLYSMTEELDNPSLYYAPALLLEALSSSEIEGTRTTMQEVLEQDLASEEMEDKNGLDTQLVSWLRDGIEYGWKRLKKEPLTTDLLLRIHDKLFNKVNFETGSFRDEQNHIGPYGAGISEATYIPPPAEEVPELMENLVDYLNDEDANLPLLLRSGIAHYQFEAIHPFEDGNGRIGRLLVVILMCYPLNREKPLLTGPFFHISDFFLRNKDEYYDRLMRVSTHNNYKQWLKFFLRGVIQQTEHTIEILEEANTLRRDFKEDVDKTGIPDTCEDVVDLLFKSPLLTIPYVQEELDIAYITANKAVHALEDLDILVEEDPSSRPKKYMAPEIFRTLYRDFELELG